MFGITQADVEEYFTYHTPTPDQIPRYEKVRAAAKQFAQTILENTPGGADQTAAIRQLRLTVMAVNQSIALEHYEASKKK